MKNTFGWMHLQSPSVGDAHAFYEALFDWKIEHKGMKDDESYTEIDAGDGPCGGISKAEDIPPMWVAFVNVEDIHKSTDKAKSLGGAILNDVTEIDEGMGWYSIIQDPTGAVVGLYQPPAGN